MSKMKSLLIILLSLAIAVFNDELGEGCRFFASAFPLKRSIGVTTHAPCSTSSSSSYSHNIHHHRLAAFVPATIRITNTSTKSTLALASSSQQQQQETSPKSSKSLKRTIYLHIWVILTSTFIILNAKYKPFPLPLLSLLNRPQWALVHAISSMIFSGTIIFSTVMEYAVLHSLQSNNSVIQFWFGTVPRKLDANVVLPALTGIIVSGVGQATLDYGGLASSPKHVVGAFHLLSLFGLWWMVTDVTSQRKAVEAVKTMKDEDDGDGMVIPTILQSRVVSNIVSCVFVVGLYALMVLKPGFG